MFTTKEDIVVYRGEGGYGILSAGKNPELGMIVEKFTTKIGKIYSEKEVNQFANNNLVGKILKQKRFLSTSMTLEGCEEHKGVILWEELIIPKGTHGAFIEGFCVEKPKEAEFLIQAGSNILINHARYEQGLWFMKGIVKQ